LDLLDERMWRGAGHVVSMPSPADLGENQLDEDRGRAASDPDVRHRRLVTLTAAFALNPVPIDSAVAEAWAALRVRLRDLGLRMPVNASWIAATAISLGVPVVTQDDDYVSIAGLDVIHV
jgi:predicted nucleic acid-binding protein